MTNDVRDRTPSWLSLFVAALLIGPTVLAGAYTLMLANGEDRRPRGPEFRSLSGDSVSGPSGYIAYVMRARGTADEPRPSCVWVVHASGAQAPRRLGCSGRRGVPSAIAGLAWTPSGDLEVAGGQSSEAPTVLRVYAGRAAPDAIAEVDRSRGRRDDGALVQTAPAHEAPHTTARLLLTEPGGSARTLASVQGPEAYAFGAPQWSPDGKWILLSDIHGRLLIADERGRRIRELLPAHRSRRLIGAPLLTWFQGGPF